jgi:acyl-CoA thioesterase I
VTIRRPPVASALVVLLAIASGCGASGSEAPAAGTSATPHGTPSTPADARTLRFVALGDSYTIGSEVDEPDSWPSQLVIALRTAPPAHTLTLAANLGVDGFTSDDLVRVELPPLDGLAPGFVSLLVGVNDVVQGVVDSRYQANVERILDDLLRRLPANRIVCVETPDYTVTPQGRSGVYGYPEHQQMGIAGNNGILRSACGARSIVFVGGIFDISEAAASDPGLVARDSLHPSPAQYRRWVNERIEPAVRRLLDQP